MNKLLILSTLVGLTGCAVAPPVAPPLPATPDLAGVLKAAAEAETSVINVTPAAECCPQQTLPQFLGVTGLCGGFLEIFDRIRNRLGMVFPGLEATPELLAITDPANMAADAPPAVKAAADIKAQEDQAAQKIKALRYLATIGCGGCYTDVEDAFIAAMEDCTEEVRYEAVVAIRETTCKKCCFCAQGACCTEKIQNKLRELADDGGGCCGGEPSARVRRQARMALAECGPPVVFEEAPAPTPEGPTEGPTEGADEGADAVPPPPPEPLPEGDRTTLTSRPQPAPAPERSVVNTAAPAAAPSDGGPELFGAVLRALPPTYVQ